MKFDIPETYVDAATVCDFYGITKVTLWRWQNDDMPMHQMRPHGRRYFKLSECEAWFLENRFACTATPAGQDHVA